MTAHPAKSHMHLPASWHSSTITQRRELLPEVVAGMRWPCSPFISHRDIVQRKKKQFSRQFNRSLCLEVVLAQSSTRNNEHIMEQNEWKQAFAFTQQLPYLFIYFLPQNRLSQQQHEMSFNFPEKKRSNDDEQTNNWTSVLQLSMPLSLKLIFVMETRAQRSLPTDYFPHRQWKRKLLDTPSRLRYLSLHRVPLISSDVCVQHDEVIYCLRSRVDCVF